jgi:hypothetical protein
MFLAINFINLDQKQGLGDGGERGCGGAGLAAKSGQMRVAGRRRHGQISFMISVVTA